MNKPSLNCTWTLFHFLGYILACANLPSCPSDLEYVVFNGQPPTCRSFKPLIDNSHRRIAVYESAGQNADDEGNIG